MNIDQYTQLPQLCLYREARGEPRAAKLGILWVLKNRVANPTGPYRHCHDLSSNILCPFQFSSFLPSDPNYGLFPVGDSDDAWNKCCEVVISSDPDLTNGANTYHSYAVGDPKWPTWATIDRQTVMLGRLRFYKL